MTETQDFEVFMRNYQNMVYSTAVRLLADQAEAEDVSQEVFLKAYRNFDRLRNNPSAGGWLKTVTTHLSLNHLSRYRSRWSFFSELLQRGAPEKEEVEFAAPQDIGEELAGLERRAWVEQILQKLPDAQRVPLVLYHLEGYSYDEIARKLGVSLGKVKTDIFRGRETFRRKLRLKLDSESSALQGL